MFKRIISLGLCLVMVAVLFAGCGNNEATTTTPTNAEDLPSTINLVGITDEATTAASVELVEEALNKLTKTRYKTKVELTLVTAEEYIKEVDKRVEEAEQSAVKVQAITKYNTLAQKEANNAQKLMNESSGKKNNKWTAQVAVATANTLSTGAVYTAEETTVYEDGRIETVYPDAQSPIDILMISDKAMYDDLNEKGYLLSVEKKLDEKFTKFRQYIYPTYFSQLKMMTGDINAIPNNNLLAKYTYLVVDSGIADEFGFNIDDFENYDDLTEFLAYVKENHPGVAPLATTPDALGIVKYMNGEVAIGTYCDPIYGYNTIEGTDFEIKNLLDIKEYQDHVALMKVFSDENYIDDTEGKDFAVNVIEGDASVAAEYMEKGYEVKVIQNPFVEPDTIFNGMMAVASCTSSEDRSLEIIEMLTTDPEAKNILQYGICDNGDNTDQANYKLVEVEEGKYQLQKLENPGYIYKMENHLTGNVYMGYPDPEEGLTFNAWDYYKQTNLDSTLSPFLHLYVEDAALDDILDAVLTRSAIVKALKECGIDVSYDQYVKDSTAKNTPGIGYIKSLRYQNRAYLVTALAKANASSEDFNLITNLEATDLVNEFVTFVYSKEGQQALLDAGYKNIIDPQFATPYVPADSTVRGTVTLIAKTGADRTYPELAFKGLAEKFQEFCPNVTVKLPEPQGQAGYDAGMSVIMNQKGTVGIVVGKLVDDLVGEKDDKIVLEENVMIDLVAQSYATIMNDPNNKAYPQSWFEAALVDKLLIDEPKYAQLISAKELEQMVKNKVAILGGASNFRSEGKLQPDSQRLTLAAAKNSAKDYYTNIKYLRVMTNELLFKDLEQSERDRYAAMTDLDFENAVFEYIKANTPEDGYEKRVQDFMVSVLEYTSEEDSSVKYLVTWDEFVAARDGSEAYADAAADIFAEYKATLIAQGQLEAILNLSTLNQNMELVYDVLLDEYLAENGLDKDEFIASVKNKYLGEVGTNASDFEEYSKTSDEYKNYIAKLRKKFKNILVDNFSATAYKNGEKGISNEAVLDTLYEHFLEEEAGIYNKLAEMAGMSVEDYRASEAHYANFSKYVKTLKTRYIYTLRAADYKDSDINKWTGDWDAHNAAAKIMDILAESGYYTNEMARYIGLDLSNYMLAKSNAAEYQNYMKAIADALEAEIDALPEEKKNEGYDKESLIEGDGTKLEEIAEEIVAKKFFADKKGISDLLKETAADYCNKNYTDAEEMKADADALASDPFFMSVVEELQAMWVRVKEEAAA